MRTFWKSSLFLYEVEETEESSPTIVFWRATVFTFHSPVAKRVLWKVLKEFAEAQLTEPKDRSVAWESRQVEPSESRGLGFNAIEICRAERKGRVLQRPESRVAVWQLQAYEHNLRLGLSEFGKLASDYRKYKGVRKALGVVAKQFWKWLTR